MRDAGMRFPIYPEWWRIPLGYAVALAYADLFIPHASGSPLCRAAQILGVLAIFAGTTFAPRKLFVGRDGLLIGSAFASFVPFQDIVEVRRTIKRGRAIVVIWAGGRRKYLWISSVNRVPKVLAAIQSRWDEWVRLEDLAPWPAGSAYRSTALSQEEMRNFIKNPRCTLSTRVELIRQLALNGDDEIVSIVTKSLVETADRARDDI